MNQADFVRIWVAMFWKVSNLCFAPSGSRGHHAGAAYISGEFGAHGQGLQHEMSGKIFALMPWACQFSGDMACEA